MVSINPFEVFCDISFDAPPATKSIEACRNVLQELERALQQIDNSAKIVNYALTLEKSPDGHVDSIDVYIKNEASIPKIILKTNEIVSAM